MRLIIKSVLAAGLGLSLLMTQGYAAESGKIDKTIKKLKSDCKADLKKHCDNVTPGEGRLAACLNSVEDQLSPTCKGTWVTTKAEVSMKIDKTEVAFRKDCGKDVQKYCADVPSGRSRLLGCLNKHEQDLSASCKNFQARIQNKVDELIG